MFPEAEPKPFQLATDYSNARQVCTMVEKRAVSLFILFRSNFARRVAGIIWYPYYRAFRKAC